MPFEQVEINESGYSVYMCQLALRMLGYLGSDGKPLSIDGDCGTKTVYAINMFQKTMIAYGYDVGTDGKPDGQFGPKCWHLLGVI